MKNPNRPVDPRETRNLLAAVILSVAVIFFWQAFFAPPKPVDPVPAAGVTAEAPVQDGMQANMQAGDDLVPQVAGRATATAGEADLPRIRSIVLGETTRIKINAPKVHGSINLQGARLDDLTLANYRETVDPASAEITLLSPAGTQDAYYADFGWQVDGVAQKMPDSKTVWTLSKGSELSFGNPVELTWDNGQGLLFTRTFSVDEHYMFTVTDSITNKSDTALSLHSYGLIARSTTPDPKSMYLQHEGGISVLGGRLQELPYKDLQEEGTVTATTTGGWLGFTDKYWLVALVPAQDQAVSARLMHAPKISARRYQTDFMTDGVSLAAGQSYSITNHLFAGAKEVNVLDGYEDSLNIPRFDRAIDFGWFYFLTKPFFYALDLLAAAFGSFAAAILVFTVIIRALLFPIADKAYVSMSKMKALTPKIKEIREAYASDPQRQSKEMMALYKKEKLNPASGCLPILIQIPIFFALYKVLFVSLEMRHAPFFGILSDLSAADPSNLFTLFGLLPWEVPSMLHLGVLPILMGLSMWLQMKMNPPPTDPSQRMIFAIMPWLFMFMMARFPAGLIIYWTWSNILSMLQQYIIMRRMKVRVFD